MLWCMQVLFSGGHSARIQPPHVAKRSVVGCNEWVRVGWTKDWMRPFRSHQSLLVTGWDYVNYL